MIGTKDNLKALETVNATVYNKNGAFNLQGLSVNTSQSVSNFTKLNNAFTAYNGNLSKSTQLQNAYIQAVGKQNVSLGNYLAGLNGAKASMGGYVKSLIGAKAASIGLQAASLALNAAISMGLSLAISALVSTITKWVNKEKEAREEAIENAKAAKEESNNLSELLNKYNQLSREVKSNQGVKEDLLDVQSDLLEALGIEASQIDTLIEKYGDLDTAINQVTLDSLREAQGDLMTAVDAYEGDLIDVGKGYAHWYSMFDRNILSGGQDSVKAFDILEKAGVISSGSHGTGGGSLVLTGNDKTVEGILENYQKLKDAQEALNTAIDNGEVTIKEMTANPLYQAINERLDELDESIGNYNTAVDDLNKNIAQQQILKSLSEQSSIPETQEEFEAFKQSMINTAVASTKFVGSQDDIRDSIINVLSTMPEFEKFFDEIKVKSETFNNETDILSEDSIKKVKDYQSELKSLYEALNLLRSGIATPTAINELIQKFPELSKHIDDLEGGIEELVEKKLEELRKAFDGAINEEALKRLAEYSVKQEAVADSIKSTTSALNDMTSAYKNVADAMKQYNETGYISLELLESIMAMKPEYLGALLDEWNNMNNAADAYKAYVKVRLAEYEAEAWAESNTNRREALAQYYVDGDRIKYDKAVETSIDALAAKLKFVQGIRDNLDKWVSGIGSGSSSSSSSTFDWLEVFLKRIEEKINKVKKVASDTWKSWTDRGKALNSVISETNKELSAQEKAYKTYLDAANKVELSDTLKKRVIEGDSTLPNDKSIDSGTRDKINEFKDLYEKSIEAKDKVDDLRQSLQEYASQRISNISKQFDDQISSIEAKKENLDNRITYLNENGISNTIDIYEALIERENEILIENAQKKKALESELTNYNVGTEAWYELKSKINDVSSAIDESRISLVKFENEIRQAKWDGFDRLINKINLVIEESDFLTEVLSYDELIDDMGSYTSEGLSTLALHKSNYDVNLAEAKGYTEELKQLRQELADNPANQKLIDRENELQKAQRDTILSAYKEKQAMIDLEKEAIQKQIEAMNKLIDKKKEALNVEKDLYDYRKNLKSKTDNIANLQKQIAVYSQDNSEAGMQKLQSLQKQLSDAQEDLKDTQYDKWVQEQQNMLDELMEEYETVQNEAMNDTDKKFNELCTVIEDNQDRIVEAINNLSNGLVSNNASDNLNDTLMGTSVEDLISYINDSINEITQAETDKLVEKFNDEVSVPFDNIQSIADSNDKRIELTDDIKNVIISDIPEVKDGLTDIDSSIESSSESIVEQLGKVKNVVENCFSVTGTWFSNLSEDLKSLVESNSTATSGKSIAGHSYIMDQLLNGGKLITTGGRPIAGLKGYATGLRKSTSNHLAWTQENGLELIYRKYDGAMLTPIGNGDTVFTSDMTDNLWNIANSFKPLDVSAIKKQSSNSNSVLSIGQIVLPNVKNYEEFRNELVKDNLFKNEIAKSTANKIVTTNKL